MTLLHLNHGEHRGHGVPKKFLILLLSVLSAISVVPFTRAAEPFLQKRDVIALVGGEDMVVAGELGYLELLLTRALPEFHLRFRSLAWEGDTVFEQRRDLNFPPLEAQLDQVGATVVLCQFGQMESLAGKEQLPEFIAAYGKLIEQMRGKDAKRRIVLLWPRLFEVSKYPDHYFGPPTFLIRMGASSFVTEALKKPLEQEPTYIVGIRQLAAEKGARFIRFRASTKLVSWPAAFAVTRDGVHGNDLGQIEMAADVGGALLGRRQDEVNSRVSAPPVGESASLLALIGAKNRLWFDYWRVQNWAFLAGDRTNQPSSRYHRDLAKRWFPAEREEFLPLIAAKEAEIDALAAKLAQP